MVNVCATGPYNVTFVGYVYDANGGRQRLTAEVAVVPGAPSGADALQSTISNV